MCVYNKKLQVTHFKVTSSVAAVTTAVILDTGRFKNIPTKLLS